MDKKDICTNKHADTVSVMHFCKRKGRCFGLGWSRLAITCARQCNSPHSLIYWHRCSDIRLERLFLIFWPEFGHHLIYSLYIIFKIFTSPNFSCNFAHLFMCLFVGLLCITSRKAKTMSILFLTVYPALFIHSYWHIVGTLYAISH